MVRRVGGQCLVSGTRETQKITASRARIAAGERVAVRPRSNSLSGCRAPVSTLTC